MRLNRYGCSFRGYAKPTIAVSVSSFEAASRFYILSPSFLSFQLANPRPTRLFRYVQFAPVVYIVKLHVELTMAALIVKVAQSSGNSTHASALSTPGNTYPNGSKNCPTLVNDSSLKSGLSTVDSAKLCAVSDWVQMDAGSAAGSEAYLVQTTPGKSIVKTVTTVVKVGAEDELGNVRRKTQECGHSWTTLH